MLDTPAQPPASMRAAAKPKTSSAGQPVPVDPDLHIGQQPHDRESDTKSLLRWIEELRVEQPRVLGFPGALDFDYSALAPALAVFANNVGDPGVADASGVSAKNRERAVVRFFAETAEAPEDVYGYLTTGGSEGIRYGLQAARERLPHAHVYISDQAHDAVRKEARTLGMKVCVVASGEDGSMDPDDLKVKVLVHRRLNPRGGRGPGAIVLATIGTTMKGAYDDVTSLRLMASVAGQVYVHADAALDGLVAAHAPSRPGPRWNFTHGAHSVSMSGHKVIGTPVPCGVLLIRSEFALEPAGAEYVKAADRTLGCSRSGLAALFLWSALRRLGHDGVRERIRAGLETAEYAVTQLEGVGVNPSRPADSLIVCLDRPDDRVVNRWHLACEGDRAHIVTVAHVGRPQIDALCADLASRRRS
ncbi:pyridoxal-dependent decarboxylase [Streptomyces sp. NPDC059881]|uniref:pyridoxal-dependent decarboxylase n=1 Tax=Streptomyces sp. NPDC059881 TaxID=3346986 RepID=UPI0036520798